MKTDLSGVSNVELQADILRREGVKSSYSVRKITWLSPVMTELCSMTTVR